MKVKDFMHKPFVTVTPDESVRKAIELIFNFHFSGIPVVQGKKLVGIITEEDILQKLFPSVKDFMENISNARDFEAMEKNISDLMTVPVKNLMTKHVRTVGADNPIMRAQSMMIVNGVGRLPVIDEKRNLVGIISQGDIFRAVVGSEIPHNEAQEFRDWLSYHYDLVVHWKKRLSGEIVSLTTLFKQKDAISIIDLMTGTGEHPIQLAKEGFHITGIDDSERMIKKANSKLSTLSKDTQEHITFIADKYLRALNNLESQSDAAILMGNALPYMYDTWKEVLKKLAGKLRKNGGVLVLQLRNLDLFFQSQQPLQEFIIAQSRISDEGKYAFVTFYNPPSKTQDYLTGTMSIIQFDGLRWAQSGIKSAPLADIRRQHLAPMLKKIGFKKISYYGSNYGEPLFKEKFSPTKHYWLNVIATR